MDSGSILLQKVGDDLPMTVFLPGWATDYRVFDSMDLSTNRLFPIDPLSPSLCGELSAFIRAHGLAPVALMGWSLGGFVAVDFARSCPDLVSDLLICGVRRHYPVQQIDATRRSILDNRERFLASFYRQCFLPAQKDDYHWFRDQLLGRYVEEMDADHLLTSLDYLAQVRMEADSLPARPICMIHGYLDLVAPVHEAEALAKEAGNVQLSVLPNAGHAAFLTTEARLVIERWLSTL